MYIVGMKFRLPFSSRFLWPYLLIFLLFLILFLGEPIAGLGRARWLSLIGIAAVPVLALWHRYLLKTHLRRIGELLQCLQQGSIPEFSSGESRDEIGNLEKQLETHISNLRKLALFSRSMASGDFTGRFETLSGDDELGSALISLKKSLMKSLEESESRRMEEKNRTWSAQGLAKFSYLFREAEDNLHDLAGEVISELVSYTEADVGALYISMDDRESGSPKLEMFGSYAFDREKHLERSFEFGEGLVGRAALEKEPIYMTDMPPDYIKIRSGLGEDVPSAILLVPVMLDNNVLGVMELASLGEIPAYQIEFIRQLGDALATTLAKVKANLQTRELFEQTKKQAEALVSQEKVFRENLLTLEKAQEASALREAEMRKEIESLRKRLE